MKRVGVALCLSAVVMFAVFPGGIGAEDAKTHRVVKGDTLWDISARQLQDPFLWPAIWETNPDINNPDLIYPDQDIRLPTAAELAARRGEAPPAEGTGLGAPAPMGTAPMEGADRMAGSRWMDIRQKETGPKYLNLRFPLGFVSSELPSRGKVRGMRAGNTFSGQGDGVLLDLLGAAPGQRYGVYRDTGRVWYQDAWKARDKDLGHLVLEVGIIEIREEKGGSLYGHVERSFEEIMAGDILGDVPDLPQIKKDALSTPANSSVEGLVIALKDRKNLAGSSDIVYLDVGANDGVAPGNKLAIFSGKEDGMEKQHVGELVVLRTTASTATAMVYRSNREIHAGDRITAPL